MRREPHGARRSARRFAQRDPFAAELRDRDPDPPLEPTGAPLRQPGPPPGERLITIGRRGTALAVLFIIGTWVVIWARFRASEARPPPAPPALPVWEVPGCYELAVGTWTPAPGDEIAEPERRLMLLPDSLDEWGRPHDTYRAVPYPAIPQERAPYRWFVRADTLWVVWSGASGSGGLALRGSPGRGFVGRARVMREEGADATARVEAARVNCATREPWRDPVPRR